MADLFPATAAAGRRIKDWCIDLIFFTLMGLVLMRHFYDFDIMMMVDPRVALNLYVVFAGFIVVILTASFVLYLRRPTKTGGTVTGRDLESPMEDSSNSEDNYSERDYWMSDDDDDEDTQVAADDVTESGEDLEPRMEDSWNEEEEDYIEMDYWTSEDENDEPRTSIKKGIPRELWRPIDHPKPAYRTAKGQIYEAFGIRDGEEIQQPAHHPNSLLDKEKKSIEDREREKKEQSPSMYSYDPRCLAKEFIDLDPETFLVDSSKLNLCFLNTVILAKICANLIPLDFIKLSLTCRYLHWRMFTFTTCYAPYEARMKIRDKKLREDTKYRTMPEMVYRFNVDLPPRDGWDNHFRSECGYRGFFVTRPDCFRKPFVFDTLDIILELLHYKKEDFDRCLPYILPLRKYAKHLEVNFHWRGYGWGRELDYDYYRLIDYQATNDFLEKVKPISFGSHVALPEMFLNSGFLRKMDTGHSGDLDYRDPLEKIFLNRIGYYIKPTDDAVKRTFNEFFYGATNLEYHSYHTIQKDDQGGFPLLEYLFSRFAPEDEYYLEDWGYYWTMTIATKETGRRHRVEILKFNWEEMYVRRGYAPFPFFVSIRIGKEETFDKYSHGWVDLKYWYKMETAVEPDEEEEEPGGDEEGRAEDEHAA